MQQALRDLQPVFRERHWPEIRVGVGINTGRMSVATWGPGYAWARTVMGDAVNLASRLGGIMKEYGADIIVGEETHKAVPDIVFLELDRVRVKGKGVAAAIYEPLGLHGEVDAGRIRERELLHEALALYRAQRWDEAEAAMGRVSDAAPGSRRHLLFVERIAYLRVHPPGSDWDGAYTFTTK